MSERTLGQGAVLPPVRGSYNHSNTYSYSIFCYICGEELHGCHGVFHCGGCGLVVCAEDIPAYSLSRIEQIFKPTSDDTCLKSVKSVPFGDST